MTLELDPNITKVCDKSAKKANFPPEIDLEYGTLKDDADGFWLMTVKKRSTLKPRRRSP